MRHLSESPQEQPPLEVVIRLQVVSKESWNVIPTPGHILILDCGPDKPIEAEIHQSGNRVGRGEVIVLNDRFAVKVIEMQG